MPLTSIHARCCLLLVLLPGLLAPAALAQSSTQTTLQNPPAEANLAFLVTFGIGDRSETKWDGSLTVENGELVRLTGYEMGAEDLIHPPRRWEMSTRPAFPFQRRGHDEGILADLPPDTFLTPRFHVYLRGSDATRVSITTEQGDFAFRASEIGWGAPKSFVDGRAAVERSVLPILAGRGGGSPADERLTDNDFASIAVARDDSIWLAWAGFDGEADRVYAQRIAAGQRAAPKERPHAVSPKGGDVYRTAAAEDSEGKIWVIWSERIHDNWDLYARSFDGEAWSRIERLTRGSQPDIQHAAASDSQGRVHLVWQGFRNNRAGIFYRNFHPESGWSDEERVSAPDAANCWEPSITIDGKDNVYAGWDQYGPNGYDVWMRPRLGNRWQDPVGVATTARFEAYLTLAADAQDRVWLAWHESGVNWGKDFGYPFDIQANAVGLYQSRNLRVAVYEGSSLQQPAQDLESSLPPPGPGNNFYEYPQVAADASGRVWVFFRHRRPAQHNVYSRTPLHHALWEIYASYYEGGRWSPMMLMPYSTGRNDMRIHASRDSQGRLVAAWPTDRRNFRDFVNMMGDVFTARMPLIGREAAAPQLTAFSPPPVEPAPQPPQIDPPNFAPTDPVHPNEEEDVRRIREYVYKVDGKQYRIFRGDMHRHTEISWDGYSDGSTEDTYRYAIDSASLDFLAITEHNFGIEDEYDWWRSQKLTDVFRVGSFFVPLVAYERSLPYPNGHRNVVFPYRGAPPLDYQHYEWNSGSANFGYTRQGPERLFAYLRKYKAVAMPHTSATGMGTDWADYDPEVEPVVEIYQSDRNSYECEGCWRSAPTGDTQKQFGGYKPDGMVSRAWEKGYRLGVQASSDHLATHTSYSMVLAEENTREALVDAIRKRHTYGATDNIIVDFRLVDGDREYLMGEDATASGPPQFRIHIEGTDVVGEVEVVKNNRMVYRQEPGTKVADFTYRDNEAPDVEEASFYYVRVRQNDRDRQVAWSSPIWVTLRR